MDTYRYSLGASQRSQSVRKKKRVTRVGVTPQSSPDASVLVTLSTRSLPHPVRLDPTSAPQGLAWSKHMAGCPQDVMLILMLMLVCWCVGVLVCWCVGVLVCWCVGVGNFKDVRVLPHPKIFTNFGPTPLFQLLEALLWPKKRSKFLIFYPTRNFGHLTRKHQNTQTPNT